MTDEDIRDWPAEDDVVIYICNVKGLPIAFDDAYTARKNKTLNVNAPGVLDNDYEEDGDASTAIWEKDPQHGEVTLEPDRSFSYTPDDNYKGLDSFEYKASDVDGDSPVAMVVITVK